jgi:hypothetical protein
VYNFHIHTTNILCGARSTSSLSRISQNSTRYATLAYLGHFVMVVSMLLRCYVIDIATNLESLKRHFMSCGNCDELEQTLGVIGLQG